MYNFIYNNLCIQFHFISELNSLLSMIVGVFHTYEIYRARFYLHYVTANKSVLEIIRLGFDAHTNSHLFSVAPVCGMEGIIQK